MLKPRRTNGHYLQFIEAVTFYHQYQREKKVDKETGEIFIETTLQDIEEANKLMKEILLRKSDDLTGACRSHFEKLKLYLKERDNTNPSLHGGSQKGAFTNREISYKFRISLTTVKRYHLDLYNAGYLKLTEKKKQKGYLYEIVSYEEYQQLKQGIETILDENLQRLKQPTGPVTAQKKSGLIKKKKTKALAG